jgi:predicted phosphate transport protein (TIGR00153 family)
MKPLKQILDVEHLAAVYPAIANCQNYFAHLYCGNPASIKANIMALTPTIFSIFARSPIKPLQQHMAKAHTCAQELLVFFTAVIAGNWDEAGESQLKIAALEHDADKLKKQLCLQLPKSLFLSVARSDVLDLLATQDLIANKSKDISGLIYGRKMQMPAVLAAHILIYVERSIDASTQAQKIINELDELLETGFSGPEVKVIETMIDKLDSIEHETDEMQIKLRHQLQQLENDLPPVEVMFLYTVIESIGEIADWAQQVGRRLQLLLAN